VQQTGNFADDKLGLTPKFKKIDTTAKFYGEASPMILEKDTDQLYNKFNS